MSNKNALHIITVSALLFFIYSFFLHNTPAQAFLVNKTQSGAEIKWGTLNVPYAINASEGPGGNLTAINNAMKTWTNVSSAPFSFVYDGQTSSTAYGIIDDENIVCFGSMSETGVLAKTTTWFYSTTGEIIDSDVKFNTNYPWGTDRSPDDYDVQNIGTHEFGHALGLADLYGTNDSEKTMYGFSNKGETKKRTLDQDDINGITYLYGNGKTTSSTSTVPLPTTTTTAPITFTTTTIATSTITTTTTIPPVREADFTGIPTSGFPPLQVVFTNLSKGDILYHFWDFGDGSTISYDANPTHKYRRLGTYTVTLTVAYKDGSKKHAIKENYISVEFPCLFSAVLKNPKQIHSLRLLRDSSLDNNDWVKLFALYYKHAAETTVILYTHPELKDRFQKLLEKTMHTVEELSTVGVAAIHQESVNETITFLNDLKGEGSQELQNDIDSVLNELKEQNLLDRLAIYTMN